MYFFWNMSIPIKNEWSSVSVSAHILKYKPFSNICPLKIGFLLLTNLIKTITCWTKNCSRNPCCVKIDIILILLDNSVKFNWNWVIVIVNHIIKWPIYSVINIECLSLALATFSTVYFCRNSSWPTHKITARLCYKS